MIQTRIDRGRHENGDPVAQTGRRPDSPPEVSDNRPKLADGIELLGEYEGSGYKQAPYLARRSDGQMVQLTELLYLVAEHADGRRDDREIATAVTEKFGRKVSPNNVRFLVERKLRPLGVLVGPDGTTPRTKKPDPLLALKLKTVLVPERGVVWLTRLFGPLFWPPVMIAVLAGLIAMDVWFFGIHGVAQSIRHTLYQPLVMLLLYGLLILSIFWHEIGHATACAYGGAKPGVIGFGIYLVWPAFYTDVTDAYRLNKAAKVRTDLGGLYFNAIFSLLLFGVYWVTGLEFLLALVLVQHLLALYQFMPFLRMDGYYVISDLTGVPDLFSRMRPILRSLVPWSKKGKEKEITALKPWVRWTVTAWVLLTVPFLVYGFASMVLAAPRVLATGYDSFARHYRTVIIAFGRGENARAASSSIQAGMLVLPLAGMGVTFSRLTGRMGRSWMKLRKTRPAAAAGLLAVAVVAAAAVVWNLLPGPHYRPIGPHERGTVQEAVRAVTTATTPSQSQLEQLKKGEIEPPGMLDPSAVPSESPSPDISPTPAEDSTEDNSEPSPSPSPGSTAEPDLEGGAIQ